jgi:hypothetical protein
MLQRPNPGTPQHIGGGATLGGEREVAPLRRLEVEHGGGTGHFEFGRTVVGLGVLNRAGDGVDEPVLAEITALDEVPQDEDCSPWVRLSWLLRNLYGPGDIAFELALGGAPQNSIDFMSSIGA